MAYLVYSLLILITSQYYRPLKCAYVNDEVNGSSAPPAIHSPRLPAKSIVVETIATTITCAFESIPSSNITWSYDSGVIGVASQKVKKEGKYFITIGTLYIETPMASMNGKNINCTGKSSIGSPVTQKTILAVEDHAIALSVNPVHLAVNSKIQINCRIIGTLRVRSYEIYLNDVLIANPRDGKWSIDVSPSNCGNYTGAYKCAPSKNVGDGHTKTVWREFTSSVTLNASSNANESQEVTLGCLAKGCLTSDITWKKDGVSFGKTGNSLHLLSVTRNDTGEYSCHATFWKNDTKSAKMTFTVNYKPENMQFTTLTLKPKNGNKVTLFCSSNGIPTPTFHIYKVTGSSSTLITNSGSHSIPSINHVDYTEYKATFRCESFNIVGKATKDIELDIQVKPLLAVSSDQQIKEGSNVTFICNIIAANPFTTIVWKDPTNTLIQHSNGVVMLNTVSAKQGGIYSCSAKNSAGETTKSFRLTVGDKDGCFPWPKNQSSKTKIIDRVIGGLFVLVMICVQF